MSKGFNFLCFSMVLVLLASLAGCGTTSNVGLRYALPATGAVNPDFTVVITANQNFEQLTQNLAPPKSGETYYRAASDLAKCVIHLGHLPSIGSETSGGAANCTAYAQSLSSGLPGEPTEDPLSQSAFNLTNGKNGYVFVVFVFKQRQCLQIFGAQVIGNKLRTSASGQEVTEANPQFTLAGFPEGGGLPSTCFSYAGS